MAKARFYGKAPNEAQIVCLPTYGGKRYGKDTVFDPGGCKGYSARPGASLPKAIALHLPETFRPQIPPPISYPVPFIKGGPAQTPHALYPPVGSLYLEEQANHRLKALQIA
jgi:hypothetical protein